MLVVSLGASLVTGLFAAIMAYFLGSGLMGIIIAYAVVGQIVFAAIIAMLVAGPREDDLDFQQQVELDLLAMKEKLMDDAKPAKRISVFRPRRSRIVPRPFNPTA